MIDETRKPARRHAIEAYRGMQIGDRVRIIDGSEAHGDCGVIDTIQSDGLILVTLDQGCIWPVTRDELETHEARRGYVLSPETKVKLSESMSEQHRLYPGKYMRKHSEETRRKIGEKSRAYRQRLKEANTSCQ